MSEGKEKVKATPGSWNQVTENLIAIHRLTSDIANMEAACAYNDLVVKLLRFCDALCQRLAPGQLAEDAELARLHGEVGQANRVVADGNFPVCVNEGLAAENVRLRELFKKAFRIAYEAPELNMTSYDEEQVEELNVSMVQIWELLKPEGTCNEPERCNCCKWEATEHCKGCFFNEFHEAKGGAQ